MSVRLSVIVPAHNGSAVLVQSLDALAASSLDRDRWELIVVDDASTDDTVAVAARHADRIVRLAPRPSGPSYARNRGVEVARGDIVVFVDADVCVHHDTLELFVAAFDAEPDVAAIFGSYDNDPSAPGIVSQYRNLLHHYVHQRSGGPAETFWAGCGAVRRLAFIEAGGYNEWHFSRPQIEDIELGHRLRDLDYRILLRPEIQARHLKRWTFARMIGADLTDRGVPWSRLLMKRGETTKARALNLRLTERVATFLVWAALLMVGVAVVARHPFWLVLAGLAVAVTLAINVPLYEFFRQRRGIAFTMGCIPLHLIYYLTNGVSVLVALALHHMIGDPTPSPTVQAFAERGVVKWPPVPKPATLGPQSTPTADPEETSR